jgi:23S rRNA (uracil1939-C5)-methyltransferase
VSRNCSHRPACPGCPRFGERGIAPAARATLRALAARHGLAGVDEIAGPTLGFRHRARLAIRGRVGSPKIGMFELDSHRVVHIPNCSVHHPLINRVAAVVRRALVDANLTMWSDAAHLGLARYLQVVVERRSQTAQVVLVANDTTGDALADVLARIRERLGADLHSLWSNAQCEPTNAILGPAFRHWHGPQTVVETFGGADVHYPPGAFGQNNLELATRLIGHVREQVPDGARVAEFYAGVGAIGLSILDRASTLRLNEVAPASLQGLSLGIDGLAAEARAKVGVVPGAAGERADLVDDADVVIADPPRKGLDAPLLDRLVERPPARFVYVSCGLPAFEHDVAKLTSSGRLRLASLTAFDLMPFTEHVETVAVFDRA